MAGEEWPCPATGASENFFRQPVPPGTRSCGLPQQRAAGLRTPAARFRTDGAVLHLLGMMRALGAADFARGNAGAEQIAHQLLVRSGDARHHFGSRKTDVRAIEIFANAGDLMRNVLLR